MTEGFSAVPESEPESKTGDAGAHSPLEIARLLERGRLDGDIGTMARVPRSHAEVSAAVVDFARVADERGRDVAALLTVLSPLLGSTNDNGTSVEGSTAAELKDFADSSAYVAPEGGLTAVPYYEDVKFLEHCDPRLIERNAAEYQRMRLLLASVGPSVERAESVEWSSDADAGHEGRLKDVKGLVQGLLDGYEAASKALLTYARAVEDARRKLRLGREAQDRLTGLISRGAVPITRTAQETEPMRRWEDLRSSTSLLDWFAELGVDRAEIVDEADRHYEQAAEAFGAALHAEQGPRGECVAALRRAKELIPGFRTGRMDAAALLSEVNVLSSEEVEAAGTGLARLPGSAPGKGSVPTIGDERVSPLLRDLRSHRNGVPDVDSLWLTDALGSRKEWIEANKAAIKAAARAYGLPPDMVAGIAWVEVGGKPYVADDVAQWLRHTAESDWSPVTPGYLPGPLAGDRDNTSYGPMAVQVRRAAETLGYDPANLTEDQRDELTTSLKDPSENLLISAKHMADLKAHTSFDVPAEEMTPGQYRELAARYNGGPYWESSDAQSYADEFEENREQAKQALK